MKRIGLFGGTFNPPHIGHLRLAMQAMQQAKLDEIIIMPAYLPPHKEAQDLISGNERLTLCAMTFDDDRFIVSDLELRRKGKSYTVDTLRALRKRHPSDELYLIIGSDMLLSFENWHCAEEILSLCTLLVLSRENEVSAEILREHAVHTLGLIEGEGFDILDAPALELSSTDIRRAVAAGEDVSALLTEEAYDYIRAKGLYL